MDASGNLVNAALQGAGLHAGDYTGSMTVSGNTIFRAEDLVGSLFSTWAANGNNVEFCHNEPYGEDLQCTPSIDYAQTNFAGKKRDIESNLDYFGARYYASSTGRFMSPDPSGLYYANPFNPQSLNLYSYGRNNPVTNTDSTGLDCVYINNDTGGYEGFNSGDCDNSTETKANSGYYVDGTVNQLAFNSQSQVIGYSASTSDGIFNSFAGSLNASGAAFNLNPYTQGISVPGQNVNVNGTVPQGPDTNSLNISSQIPAGGLQQSNMAQLRAYHSPTPTPPITGDPACYGAPDAVSEIHSVQRGNAQGQPQASTDGSFGTAIYQRTTQGDRPFGNAAADMGFNAGFMIGDYGLSVVNCLQGH